MRFTTVNRITWIQWVIIWIVGTVTFMVVGTWPGNAFPTQDRADLASEMAQVEMTDKQIVDAVRKKSAVDGIDTADVLVFSIKGIVTLDGAVLSLADEHRMRRIAIGVRGVRGVVNQLEVKPSSLTDIEIKAAATEQLVQNTATDAYEVCVQVKDGRVFLSGQVESLAEKQLAAEVVSELRGVREIESKIKINDSALRTDREMRAEIVERMTRDVWIDEQLLEVEVERGVVRVQGKVVSAELKDRLGILAWTAGTKSVDVEAVEIDPSLNVVPKRRQPSTQLDFEVRDALQQSLRLDPRVDLRELDVKVEMGVVLLAGTVGDLQSKRAAVETARNVVGVTNVIDKLEIEHLPAVADSDIEKRLGKAFARTATFRYDGITTQVKSGVVKLSGSVPSQYQRRRAEAIAYSLAGVLEVNNTIAIDNPKSDQSDFDIGLDIERGIRWSPYLNITKLKYSLEEGVVTFSGTVANRQSLDIAHAIAIDAGARDIVSTEVRFE